MKAAPRRRAAVIEDNHVSRTLLRGLLRNCGFDVAGEAPTAAQGRALALQLAPDLLCLDILLPDADGIALLAELKAQLPATRFVMVSAASDGSRVREALGAGAHGFVVKPFTEGTLQATLERVFGPARSAG